MIFIFESISSANQITMFDQTPVNLKNLIKITTSRFFGVSYLLRITVGIFVYQGQINCCLKTLYFYLVTFLNADNVELFHDIHYFFNPTDRRPFCSITTCELRFILYCRQKISVEEVSL